MIFNPSNYNTHRFPELEKIQENIPTLPIYQSEAIKRKINDPADTQFIDQKQFALTFGDTIIKGTYLTGGWPEKIARYYLNELLFWEKDPSFHEVASQIDSIRSDLQCFLEGYNLLSNRLLTVRDFKNFIQNQLDKNGKAIVPMMVNGMESLAGHVFSCVFQRSKDGTLSFFFLNKGSGSNQHPVIKSSPLGKEYRSYRSATFVLSNPIFFKAEVSDPFVRHIMHWFRTQPTIEALPLFESRYIYEDLTLFADEALTKKQLLSDSASLFQDEVIGVTSQRSGTCPEAAIRLIIRNHLIQTGADQDTIRRVMFANKMRGLKNGYHHLSLEDSPDGKINRSLLKNGAEGLAVQAIKLQEDNLISSDKLKETLILVEEVLKKVAKAEENATHFIDLALKQDFTVSSAEIPYSPIIEDRLIAPTANAMIEPSQPEECTLKIELLLQACLNDPDKILGFIKFIDHLLTTDPILSSSNDLKIATISSFLLKLPVPKPEHDSYWSLVNPAKNDQIIKKLFKLTEKLAEEPNSNLPLVRKQVIAIIHRLLCNDPKIGKHMREYTLDPEPMGLRKLFYYPNGEFENLNNELNDYFNRREAKTLFYCFENNDPSRTVVCFLEKRLFASDHAHAWLDTLNFYKSCIESLGIKVESPVEFYLNMLVGYGPDPLFKSLFYLNNLVHSARENSFLIRILRVKYRPLQFYVLQTERIDFLPLPDIKDPTLAHFAKEIRAKDILENKNLLLSLRSEVLDPGAVESLMRLRKFDKARLPLFIDWCTQHQELLHLDDVKNFLENALLNDNVIRKAESQEPKTVMELNAFLDEQMNNNQHKIIQFIFWARLSIHVESRLKGLRNDDRIKNIQYALYTCAQNLSSTDIHDAYVVATHNLYLFSLFPKMARQYPKAFIQLNSQILFLRLKGADLKAVPPHQLKNANRLNKPEWMGRSIDQLIIRSFNSIEESIVVLPEMNAYLNLPSENYWMTKYPYAACGGFRINFHKLTVHKKGRMISSNWPVEIADQFQKQNDYTKCLAHMIDRDSPAYITETSVTAMDASFRLDIFKKVLGVTVKFKINGADEDFYTCSRYQHKESNFRTFVGQKNILWVSVKDPNRYLVIDTQSFAPTGMIIRKTDSFTLERIENGKLTGEFAIDPKKTPWNDYFSSIASHSGGFTIPPQKNAVFLDESLSFDSNLNLKLFCKKNSQQQWELSTIILGRLEFRVEELNGKLRFRSKDFRDFYLSHDQWQGGFSIEGMVWLEDAKKTRCKGVIPHPEKALENIISIREFEEALKKNSENTGYAINPKIPFTYRLDSRKGQMIGEAGIASILQAVYYARQERYLEAFEALKSVTQPNPIEQILLINGIITGLNQSPAATALKMQTLLLWPTAENSKELRFREVSARYLQFCGRPELQRIPEPLRLTPALLKKMGGERKLISDIPLKNDQCFHEKLKNFFIKADSFLIGDFLENTKDALEFDGEKKISRFSFLMGGEGFTIQTISKILLRCEVEHFPSSIDLEINLFERIVMMHDDLRDVVLFQLIWLYRRTQDAKLKKCLIDLKLDGETVRLCKKLYNSLPKPNTGRINVSRLSSGHAPLSAPESKIPLPSKKSFRNSPFKEVIERNSDRVEKLRLLAETSPLEKIHFVPTDKLGQRFVEDLKKAHQINCSQKFVFYTPRQTIEENSQKLAHISKITSRKLLKKARTILNEIEILANGPTEEQFAKMSPKNRQEVVNYRLKQHGLQSIRLTFRDPLLQSLLMGHGEEIKKRNPFLKNKDISEIHTKMLQFLDLMNQKAQADAARQILVSAGEKNDAALFSKAVHLLNHDRRYDLHSYPELAIYEYATGFQLRPEQVELLMKIITLVLSGKNSELLQQLCFEFQAGGGKTKVISAILTARIHAEGKVPIFFSVPQLEDVTGEDLKDSLCQIFERKLLRIRFTLKDSITIAEVEHVIHLFENAVEEKCTLFMTPETWHALRLAKTNAIGRRDVLLTNAFDNLFDLFKTKGVALIDEGHLNVEALHETNRASGKPRRIPRRERKLFVTLTRHLMQDPELQKIVKLAQNKQATMLSKSLQDVQKRLSVLLCEEFSRDIQTERRNSLQNYWLNPDAERPLWMLEIVKKSEGNLHEALLLKRIDLVRGLLNVILPFTLSMTGELDYRLPQNAHAEILIPAKQGFTSNSNFQNPDVAALVSCQGTFQTGLTDRQLGKALEKFVEKFESDLRQGIDQNSKSAAFWLHIQEEAKIAPNVRFTLQKYQNATREQKEDLIKGCRKQVVRSTSLIEYYLMEEILPKVAIYPTIIQSTATNLTEGFNSRIIFSATMGIHEKYALQEDTEKSYFRDMEFMDQVMTRACLPQNSVMHWKPESTPKKLLNGIPSPEFTEIEGIINVGSFCETASCEEWADAFLSCAKERGVNKKAALYFNQDDNGKRLLCLKVVHETEKVHVISGSNLGVIFASFGLSAEQVYKVFGPSDTTGTDFLSSPHARMLLTIGDHVNLSLAIQSIMRLRGFLNDPIDAAFSQKISWVGAVDYLEKLQERFPLSPITPLYFFAYALEKEIDNDRASIMQQAIQEIEAIIVGEVEERRRTGKEIDKHLNAYGKKLGRDPSVLYGGVNSKVPTKDHLMDHAVAFASAAGLGLQELPPVKLKKIEKVADRAAALVQMTEKRVGSNLSATPEQSMLVEQKQEQRARFREDIKPVLHEYETEGSLFSGQIRQTFDPYLRSPHALVNSIFSKDLYFFENAFSLESKKKGEPADIKRVELFLVEEVDGCKQAFVLSAYDADRFISAFDDKKNVVLGKKLGIFTAAGRLVRNGPKGVHFADGEIKSLIESEWMKNIICEIGFWNGKVVSMDWMVRQLKSDQRESYLETWTWICKKHANPAHLQIATMDELIAETDDISIEMSADLADAAEYPELKR